MRCLSPLKAITARGIEPLVPAFTGQLSEHKLIAESHPAIEGQYSEPWCTGIRSVVGVTLPLLDQLLHLTVGSNLVRMHANNLAVLENNHGVVDVNHQIELSCVGAHPYVLGNNCWRDCTSSPALTDQPTISSGSIRYKKHIAE